MDSLYGVVIDENNWRNIISSVDEACPQAGDRMQAEVWANL